MSWFVLNWNPDVWRGISDEAWNEFAELGEGDLAEGRWSTGSRHGGIEPGDGLFFLRQGRDRGILAVGVATSDVYRAPHYNDDSRMAWYVDHQWREARTIDDRLRTEDLHISVPDVPWSNLYGSGVNVTERDAELILTLWAEGGPVLWPQGYSRPDEEGPTLYREGARALVTANRFERDPKARQACIRHHGTRCAVCRFDFESVYGERGKGYIEVHHLVPLSEVDDDHEVNPIEDMRPLCSNCHSMIHRGGLLTPEELADLVTLQAD